MWQSGGVASRDGERISEANDQGIRGAYIAGSEPLKDAARSLRCDPIYRMSSAPYPDLRASVAAMQRAAELARKTAIQTGTDLIVRVDGKLTRIPPDELRKEMAGATKSPPSTAE